MAVGQVVAQERPDERIDIFNLLGEVILHLGQLPMPSPTRHLDDPIILARRDVGEGAATSDLAEGDAEAAGEIGINLAVVGHRDGQGESFSYR
jgi:hypothetical protein